MSKQTPNIITIVSRLHGERTFHRVGVAPYVRKDGSETNIAIWRGACVVCGEPFEVTTSASGKSKSFEVTTCKTHRRKMTKAA
jgi:hypothetical protein